LIYCSKYLTLVNCKIHGPILRQTIPGANCPEFDKSLEFFGIALADFQEGQDRNVLLFRENARKFREKIIKNGVTGGFGKVTGGNNFALGIPRVTS
jgi:hypothetical protein